MIEHVTYPKYLKTMNRLMQDYKRYPEGFVTSKTTLTLINGMFLQLNSFVSPHDGVLEMVNDR